MTEDALRELVMSVCERDPSLILDIVDRASQAEAAQGGYHPLPGSNSPNWCVCVQQVSGDAHRGGEGMLQANTFQLPLYFASK